MSRTYRKRKESFESANKYCLEYWAENKNNNKRIEQEKAKYFSSKTNKWYTHSLPKWFRNSVNRNRRRYDKREIYKSINFEDYPEQCSKWNCKDNNSWGYW